MGNAIQEIKTESRVSDCSQRRAWPGPCTVCPNRPLLVVSTPRLSTIRVYRLSYTLGDKRSGDPEISKFSKFDGDVFSWGLATGERRRA